MEGKAVEETEGKAVEETEGKAVEEAECKAESPMTNTSVTSHVGNVQALPVPWGSMLPLLTSLMKSLKSNGAG